jgi:hypothetical protein
MALSSIAIKQSKGMTSTMEKAKQLLDYFATYPAAKICFCAIRMPCIFWKRMLAAELAGISLWDGPP